MAKLPKTLQTIVIERVAPELDGGRYPVKRIVGETLEVTADIFKEGHDTIAGILRYRAQDDKEWQETPMHHVDNDRWAGSFLLSENTRYLYSLGAYIKSFETWRAELTKKHGVVPDLASELFEGEAQLLATIDQAKGLDLETLKKWASQWKTAPNQDARIAVALDADLALLVNRYEQRAAWSTYPLELAVIVDRERARYGAWYEIFPRSEGTIEGQGGTFKDCEARLPAIRDMGFDVLYLAPIHPIGETNRKGRNNSLTAQPGEPGSPWAIGSRHGGHDAVEPALGTLEEFDQLQQAVRNHGMEIALDFAINATPDHPYVTEHPEWFKQRPDGTIKYAENPPKKYEDIYGFDFYSDAWPAIWQEMKRVFLFWIQHGVKISASTTHIPNQSSSGNGSLEKSNTSILMSCSLAEAFTKPKMMRVLAKAGFTQSYTYFTWRNTKAEMTEYLTELTKSEMSEYFRPNFFPQHTRYPPAHPATSRTSGL